MSRVTVDVGNSGVGWVVWRDGRVEPPERRAAPEDAARTLAALGAVECAAISVAPARLARLLAALPEGGRSVRVLTRPPPSLGAHELLASAGADRVANVLGLGEGPAVAVDAGTAVTVDLLDASGRYLGGYIAPGPAAAARGLAAATAALPLAAGRPAALGPGGSTGPAIDAGVWGLCVGGLDRLVDEARAALGAGRARVVVTGGWGEAWAADSRHRDVVPCADLVHRGIARWAGWA